MINDSIQVPDYCKSPKLLSDCRLVALASLIVKSWGKIVRDALLNTAKLSWIYLGYHLKTFVRLVFIDFSSRIFLAEKTLSFHRIDSELMVL